MSATQAKQAGREPLQARRIVLTGRVQGLGVRPAIARLAKSLSLSGAVRNTSLGVEIEIQGASESIDEFTAQLPFELPSLSQVDRQSSIPIDPIERVDFDIVRVANAGPLNANVPVDLATCPDCLEEVQDVSNRRHRYVFTSCATCGPRYTIVLRMPYERVDTTMSQFKLCERCQTEYSQAADRRFHAQTNACEDCGPTIWCVDKTGEVCARSNQAVEHAADALSSGRILALRGIGGYQLLTDATNEDAVVRLRRHKYRPKKPFAALVESLEVVRRIAVVDDIEVETLRHASNPIVLVRARDDSPLVASVHPGLNTVGLMLPTTPLHALLANRVGRPLVCTSGNIDGNPLEYEVDSAQRNLSGICDLWLHHDRPIQRPIDDSVVRVICGRPVTLRLARGLASLPLALPLKMPMLALGGHMKCAVAWSSGSQAVLGPHLGDLETETTRKRFVDHCTDSMDLYGFTPRVLAHDRHPNYFTTRHAASHCTSPIAVQHHHAHIAAGMLEQGWLGRTVLGVAWDGTGFGDDDSIWGGEFLVATNKSFTRFARLRPFRLPGGEAAIREPWRCCVSILSQIDGGDRFLKERLKVSADAEYTAVRHMAANLRLSPLTTSAGRLFDAAAVIILEIERADFEGQPAMSLESVADLAETGRYDLRVREGGLLELDWQPLFESLLSDRAKGVGAPIMSMRFHRSLAHGIVSVCRRQPDLPVVLSGGVFQNRLLTELVVEMLTTEGREVGPPGQIPPNDGGLAAGQLVVATASMEAAGSSGVCVEGVEPLLDDAIADRTADIACRETL